MDTPVSVDPAEINPAVATPEELASLPDSESTAHAETAEAGSARSPYLFWLLLLIAVIAFGYLSSTRREAIGTFFAQVSDVVKDFRGYEPEV